MQALAGPKKGVRCVAFSPDGVSLAASGYDGSLRVWNLSTDDAVRLGSFGTTPKSLTWAPDSKRIMWSCCASGYGRVCWTSLSGVTEELVGKDHDVGAICLAPDGRTLYTATEYAIRRRDMVTGVELPKWPANSPGFLAVSPDGRTLASTHPLSPLARIDACHVALWDTATGTQTTRLLDCAEFYDGVVFSPDGTRLAALGHQSLWLWEFPSGRVVTHHPSKKFYTGLAFSPNGEHIATSGNDGMVRIWDGKTGEPIKAFDWGFAKALCMTFSQDGTRAAASSAEGRITIWDVG